MTLSRSGFTVHGEDESSASSTDNANKDKCNQYDTICIDNGNEYVENTILENINERNVDQISCTSVSASSVDSPTPWKSHESQITSFFVRSSRNTQSQPYAKSFASNEGSSAFVQHSLPTSMAEQEVQVFQSQGATYETHTKPGKGSKAKRPSSVADIRLHDFYPTIVKRSDGLWVELRCPRCGGNASPFSHVFLRGTIGLEQHLSSVHNYVVRSEQGKPLKNTIIDLCFYKLFPMDKAHEIREEGGRFAELGLLDVVPCDMPPTSNGLRAQESFRLRTSTRKRTVDDLLL